MKKKNAGISTVEIVVAAVILAIVVIGVLVAVKMVSKGDDGDENVASADKIISSLGDHIQVNVDAADLDVSYFENTLRLVSRDDYQIYYFNKSEGQVYYLTKAYAREMTEEEKIEFVGKISISTAGAEVVAGNVTTFHATTTDLLAENATMTLKVRVVTDAENVNKDITMRINADLIAFKNGTYVAPTPTPEGGTDVDVTPTSTPSPTPEPVEEFTGVLATTNGPVDLDKLKRAPAGAKIKITVVCEDIAVAEDADSYGIGGIDLDDWNMEGSPWEMKTDTTQDAVGDEVVGIFDIKHIMSVYDSKGAKQVVINVYGGYKLVEAEIIVEE